jgi:hypothetical protein
MKKRHVTKKKPHTKKSDMGLPDLLSEPAMVEMLVVDNLVSPMISPR